MHVHHVGFRIKGFYRLAQFGHRWEMTPKDAQHRLTILQFFARYGQAATCEAFGVSRRTLYRWKQTFTQADGQPAALAARSSAPCRRRQSMWPPALSQEIRRLRTTYPNLGKAKLHVLLRPWCAQQNLALPSVSTLGRLIARAPDKMRHAPSRLDARGRPKPVARPRKARQPKGIRHVPLQVFACDTVVRLQAGLRRYLFTFIDPHTRFAVAFAAATPSSRQATLALDALCHLLPAPPRFVLSDNGSEFLGHFQQRLEERGITHWWTYPRSPKMNAHAERFNRTLQEQFVDYHEDLLFDDLADFNRKLADWLLFYNTERPHHSLRLHSPVQFLIQHQPECQRWWTHTVACLSPRGRGIITFCRVFCCNPANSTNIHSSSLHHHYDPLEYNVLMAHVPAAGPMIQRCSDTAAPSAFSPAPTAPLCEESRRCLSVHHALQAAGLFESTPAWRVSPVPFQLTAHDVSFFENLGPQLWSFSKALNRLYLDSVKGRQPFWVHQYLDQGKPPALLEYARMKRFREAVPYVIRPDVIPTETGMTITELDSVPGGIGMTGTLSSAYGALGDALVGGPDGMIDGFATLFRNLSGEDAGCLAIVVSDEAEDYRNEMDWVACRLRAAGVEAYCVHPRDLRFNETSLSSQSSAGIQVTMVTPSGEQPVSHVYRFFELFDLDNVPKSELLMYTAKKGRVSVTPPYKPWMEEKLAFALLHHPMLERFWSDALGTDVFQHLGQVMPRTWVVDPRPLPPSAIIPDLTLDGKAVSDWRQLARATQKQRQCVLKPSGFSELAWGSRGVVVGHDIPQSAWAAKLEHALDSFTSTPYVFQAFHKGRQYEMTYWDERTGQLESMEGRARLSPYYFVSGDEVTLGGILATVCPKDKKVLHGMRDAILAPCALPAP